MSLRLNNFLLRTDLSVESPKSPGLLMCFILKFLQGVQRLKIFAHTKLFRKQCNQTPFLVNILRSLHRLGITGLSRTQAEFLKTHFAQS